MSACMHQLPPSCTFALRYHHQNDQNALMVNLQHSTPESAHYSSLDHENQPLTVHQGLSLSISVKVLMLPIPGGCAAEASALFCSCRDNTAKELTFSSYGAPQKCQLFTSLSAVTMQCQRKDSYQSAALPQPANFTHCYWHYAEVRAWLCKCLPKTFQSQTIWAIIIVHHPKPSCPEIQEVGKVQQFTRSQEFAKLFNQLLCFHGAQANTNNRP